VPVQLVFSFRPLPLHCSLSLFVTGLVPRCRVCFRRWPGETCLFRFCFSPASFLPQPCVIPYTRRPLSSRTDLFNRRELLSFKGAISSPSGPGPVQTRFTPTFLPAFPPTFLGPFFPPTPSCRVKGGFLPTLRFFLLGDLFSSRLSALGLDPSLPRAYLFPLFTRAHETCPPFLSQYLVWRKFSPASFPLSSQPLVWTPHFPLSHPPTPQTEPSLVPFPNSWETWWGCSFLVYPQLNHTSFPFFCTTVFPPLPAVLTLPFARSSFPAVVLIYPPRWFFVAAFFPSFVVSLRIWDRLFRRSPLFSPPPPHYSFLLGHCFCPLSRRCP